MMKTAALLGLVILVVIATALIQNASEKIIATKWSEDFKVFTKAVCQEAGGRVYCQDKLFYSCKNTILAVETDVVYCGNQSMKINKPNLGSLEIAKP